MGKASTRAKQRYNSANYKQVKFNVKPELASAFKASCESANVSMSSELSLFMSHYIGENTSKSGYSPDLSSTRKRRAAVANIVKLLQRISDNEELYLNNIPVNLQEGDAYEISEQRMSQLDEAIDMLTSIY